MSNNEKFTLKDINLKNIESKLIESMDINGSFDNTFISDSFQNLIIDFNSRNINNNNINEIIMFCEYLQLKLIPNFIFKNLNPSLNSFIINPEIIDIYPEFNFLTTIVNNKQKRIPKEIFKYGIYDWIIFLNNNGFKFEKSASSFCVDNNHLDCLELVISLGCEINEITFQSACINGSIDCLKYLVNYIKTNSSPESLDYILNNKLCSLTAKHGHLVCLSYLHDIGCQWNINTCLNAAESGNFECLKYAHENNCEWNNYICNLAARGGNLDCLIYAHKIGCYFDLFAALIAAEEGKLDCLKYIIENGGKTVDYVCKHAAINNHYECLIYLHQKGYELHSETCYYACLNNNLKILEYGFNNGIKLDSKYIDIATKNENLEILEFLNNNICPLVESEGNSDSSDNDEDKDND